MSVYATILVEDYLKTLLVIVNIYYEKGNYEKDSYSISYPVSIRNVFL